MEDLISPKHLTKEGRQEAQQEIAKNLLKSEVDINVVAKATYLSDKQLEELKKTLG